MESSVKGGLNGVSSGCHAAFGPLVFGSRIVIAADGAYCSKEGRSRSHGLTDTSVQTP